MFCIAPRKHSWIPAVSKLLACAVPVAVLATWIGQGSESLAAAPQLERWIPLTHSTPAPAGVQRTVSSGTGVELTFSFPGLSVEEEQRPQGPQFRLSVPGAGHTADIGQPELPVIRRLIIVPKNATPAISWKGKARQQSIEGLGLQGVIRPRQPPIPKIPGARENAVFAQDTEAYSKDAWTPAEPASLKECGFLFGCRLALIEVSPVSYNPSKNEVLLYPDISITVSFNGLVTRDSPSLTPSECSTLQDLTLNADTLAATTGEERRLLIIAGNAFTNSLASFITHKQSLGWTVDLFGTATAGTSTNQIRAFVKSRYHEITTRPTALLLVGDTTTIPPFISVQTDHPDSDLYYGCMDEGSDWLPDFPIGRFSVQSTNQLDAVIAKTITTENAPDESWHRNAVFMAGDDNYTLTEATHNTVVSNYLQPRSYTCTKLYEVSFHSSTPHVTSAFNQGQALGVYSGHGDFDRWADGPLFQQSNINNLTNAPRFPFIFSFACLTGQYGVDECFAETWLRAASKGAVAIFASSTYSYWNEDDILEKEIFSAIFDYSCRSAGSSVKRAKELYLLYYGASDNTIRYFEMYNLFGDPTLDVLGLPLSLENCEPRTAYWNEPYGFAIPAGGGRKPYSWNVAEGALPAGFSFSASNGTIVGMSAVTGNWAFTLQLTDALGTSTSRTYQFPVAEHIRPPSPSALPVAVSNRPYGATPIILGGVPPYTWIWNDSYAVSNTPSGWLGETNATGWRADDSSWPLTLPWPFPFFGKSQTSLWVCSNGYIDFRAGTASYQNSLAELASSARIAPLWDDLNTTGGNIHVTTNSTRVAIRWNAFPYGQSNPLNFEAVLYRTGRIQFNYGSPVLTNIAPVIGVSAGDGVRYHLSTFNAQTSLPANTSVTFFVQSSLPPGLNGLSSGIVTGLPSRTGSFTFPCRVQDNANPPETTNFNLYLTVFDPGLSTTQGTPVWWLASFALTNTSYNNEDRLDEDGDGMAAWQEYIAGTDPTSRLSALRLLSMNWSNQMPVLEWQSADSLITPQPPYTLWSSTNLPAGIWTPLTNIYNRTPPRNTLPIPNAPTGIPAFYRITITN